MLFLMEVPEFFNSSPPSLGRDDEKQYLLLENVRLRKALRVSVAKNVHFLSCTTFELFRLGNAEEKCAKPNGR